MPAATDVFGGLDTIHIRHLDIHEHQIVSPIFHGSQDLLAICSQVCPVAEPLVHELSYLLVHGIILRNEDVQSGSDCHSAGKDDAVPIRISFIEI